MSVPRPLLPVLLCIKWR